jgi:hypothetical protein
MGDQDPTDHSTVTCWRTGCLALQEARSWLAPSLMHPIIGNAVVAGLRHCIANPPYMSAVSERAVR